MSNVSGHAVEFAFVETITAARTLTRAESGATIIAGAVDLVVTLPAVDPSMAGVFFRFYVATLSVTTGLQLSPAAADSIRAPGVTTLADRDLINTAATDAIGDSVLLVCDGVGWLGMSIRGTWARQA